MIAYKLTNSNHQTYNKTQWAPGTQHKTSGEGELCGPGWLHFYRDPLLAVLHNPIHAKYNPLVLWRCSAEGEILHDGWIKSGCTVLTTLEVIDVPEISVEQRVAYGILCAKSLKQSSGWVEWADKWLSGVDRSERSARAAADAAADADADADAYAAYAAAYAAAARGGAYAAIGAAAADAAAYAVDCASAAYAAAAAADADLNLPLPEIAAQAMKF